MHKHPRNAALFTTFDVGLAKDWQPTMRRNRVGCTDSHSSLIQVGRKSHADGQRNKVTVLYMRGAASLDRPIFPSPGR